MVDRLSEPVPQDQDRSGPGALAAYMELFASPIRLEMLRALRDPQHMGEIRVETLDERAGLKPRPMSRQAVRHHLDRLVDAGLVRKLPPGRDARKGPRYVMAQDRVFAIVDELRDLTRLRPRLDQELDVLATQAARKGLAPQVPVGARLVIAYGPDDRVAFGLDGMGPWILGRAADAAVVLDHDPFASAEHARIERVGDGWQVTDLASRNGTFVNWEPVPSAGRRFIERGDLLTVGRTQLVFQP